MHVNIALLHVNMAGSHVDMAVLSNSNEGVGNALSSMPGCHTWPKSHAGRGADNHIAWIRGDVALLLGVAAHLLASCRQGKG